MPYIDPKKRHAQKTLLFVGEGPTEKAFLDYLKGLYHVRGCGVSIKIKSADGGSPEGIIGKTIKWMRNDAFDMGRTLLDSDVVIPTTVRIRADRAEVNLFVPIPCIEGFFLTILRVQGIVESHRPTSWCKSEFYENHISEDDATDSDSFGRIFPKTLLNEKRNIRLLNDLIAVFEMSIPSTPLRS
jgi:hypothetical protein